MKEVTKNEIAQGGQTHGQGGGRGRFAERHGFRAATDQIDRGGGNGPSISWIDKVGQRGAGVRNGLLQH